MTFSHLVRVDAERPHGIDVDDGGSGERVDEVVAVPRSEGVQHGGLVEEAELGEVLHLLQGRRVRLLNVILVDLEKILVIVGVFGQCLKYN